MGVKKRTDPWRLSYKGDIQRTALTSYAITPNRQREHTPLMRELCVYAPESNIGLTDLMSRAIGASGARSQWRKVGEAHIDRARRFRGRVSGELRGRGTSPETGVKC